MVGVIFSPTFGVDATRFISKEYDPCSSFFRDGTSLFAFVEISFIESFFYVFISVLSLIELYLVRGQNGIFIVYKINSLSFRLLKKKQVFRLKIEYYCMFKYEYKKFNQDRQLNNIGSFSSISYRYNQSPLLGVKLNRLQLLKFRSILMKRQPYFLSRFLIIRSIT